MKPRVALISIIALWLSILGSNFGSAVLKTCDGVQIAQVTNYGRQIYVIRNLKDLEVTRLQKAQINFQNQSLLGNSTGVALARIEIQSAQRNIDNYTSQINTIDVKERALLKVCKVPENGVPLKVPASKIKKCTSSVITLLSSLASQYRTQQNLKMLHYDYMQKSEIMILQYQSSGQMSNAASASFDYSNYLQKYQVNEVLADFMKREFEALKSSCSNSGVSLPADFVPPAEESSSSTPAASSLSCEGADCVPDKWSDSSLGVIGANGMPSHLEEDYTSPMGIRCSNRGLGTFKVSKPRIFMAFTATDDWNTNYLQTPKESDFFKKQSDIGTTNSPLETIDLKNWIRYNSNVSSSAEVKKLSGVTVLKPTTHLCDVKIPWQSNLRTKFSSNIKGVGFFYVAETGVERPLVIYLGGFNADWFGEPQLDLSVSSNEESISISVTHQGVRAFKEFTSWGSICFKIDGDSSKFPCWKVVGDEYINRQGKQLELENIPSGKHTLEIYVPGLEKSKSTNYTYNFELKRLSKIQQDEKAKAGILAKITLCNKNFLGPTPIASRWKTKIIASNGASINLASYSWGEINWKQSHLSNLKVGFLSTFDEKQTYIPLIMNWVNTGELVDVTGRLISLIATDTWESRDDTRQQLGGPGWSHPIWMYGWQLGATRNWTWYVPISECAKNPEYVSFRAES